MTENPFSIFEHFADRFAVRFFEKAENLVSDADLSHVLKTNNIASLKQMHGKRIVSVTAPASRIEAADALITDTRGLWLTIRAADCQQLVVYAPSKNIAGVIHAGWKGLTVGIIPAFFKKFIDEWGVVPSDTFVGIGPSLCTQCAEFTDPIAELAGLDSSFFHGRNADLRGIADRQLEALGIPSSHRERSNDCTKCMSAKYWSYRGGDREKVQNGYSDVMACMLK